MRWPRSLEQNFRVLREAGASLRVTASPRLRAICPECRVQTQKSPAIGRTTSQIPQQPSRFFPALAGNLRIRAGGQNMECRMANGLPSTPDH